MCSRIVASMGAGVAAQHAASEGIALLGTRIGVEGGVIAVHPDGRIGWARSSESMAWAAVWDGGEADGC